MLALGSYEDNMSYTRSLIWVSAVLIFLAVCVFAIGLVTFCSKNQGTGPCTTISYLIAAGISVVMAILLVVWAPKARNEKLNQEQKLLRYEKINGCSDEYVKVDEHLSDVVAGTIFYLDKIPILTVVVLICTGLALFVEMAAKKMFNDDHFK